MPRVKVQTPAPTTRARVSTATTPKDRTKAPATPAGFSYFADSSQRQGLEFVSTGCGLLDQVMGGGYVLGRMTNIIGDKSTGKTLLGGIEATVNFLRAHPDGYVRYAEAESAFDKPYAAAMGMPVDRVDWAKLVDSKGESDRTVEWLFEDITATTAKLKGRPGLYVVDSLDALSDRTEMVSAIDKASYGGAKAKALSQMFRRLVGDIEQSRLLLIIISQIRDKIGVTFGETKQRAGGHAMDFYATHCLWLAQKGSVKRTVNKIERTVGVEVVANCKKNKVGLPFRKCEFPLLFGYGIDDLTAHVEWLMANGFMEDVEALGMSKTGYATLLRRLQDQGGPETHEMRAALNTKVRERWAQVEQSFLPRAGKY